MSGEVFISIDLGTTSIKFFLLRADGTIVRGHSDPINLIKDHSIRGVEQALSEVRQKFFAGLKHLVKGFEGRISGITFSSYGYSSLCLDDNFEPLSNIMTYLDGRAVKEQMFLESYGLELYRRTGCPPLFIYPISKLLWLKARGRLGSTHKVSFVKDYLAYLLSGDWYVDLGVASTTGLLNTHRLVWDDLALSLVGIDERSLPQLIDGSKIIDYITLPDLKLEKIPMSLGSMDGLLQNLAYSLYRGEAAMNLGSSAALRVIVKDVVLDRDERMRLYHYYLADGYRVTGAIFNNGMSTLEWFRGVIGLDWVDVAARVKGRVSCVDGVYALPFAQGEALPFRDPYMKFTVLGLTLGSDVGDVFRAVFEGLGYLFKEAVETLKVNGVEVGEVHCGGGGCFIREVVEVIGNVMCKPVVLYREDVSRGASSLGALVTLLRGLNYVKSFEDVRFDAVRELKSDVVMPDENLCKAYEGCYSEYLEVVKSASKLYRGMFRAS